MKRGTVFPTFSTGFFADVRIVGYHLRLFAHIDETRWASSVYSMHTNMWITQVRVAKDAEHAKADAEIVARQLLPGKHQIAWRAAALTA
jgi:hypothetical protein